LAFFQIKLGLRACFHADRSAGAEKDFTQRRKDAKNAQQYVTRCFIFALLRFCAFATLREACLLLNSSQPLPAVKTC
jgi:hypothetical protein